MIFSHDTPIYGILTQMPIKTKFRVIKIQRLSFINPLMISSTRLYPGHAIHMLIRE